MYVLFSHKELLCFYKVLLLVPSDLLETEKVTGELSIKKADFCKAPDIKKKSRLL